MLNDQYARVNSIAVEAGQIALQHFRTISTIDVESKGPLDLVTVADREVEGFICSELTRAFPDDGVFGEEGSTVTGTSGRTWVIDPIDGTFNFVRGSKDWGISIGLFEKDGPVFGAVNAPARCELFCGGRGNAALMNGERLPALRPFDGKSAAIGVGIHPNIPKQEGLKLLAGIVNDLNVAYRVTGSSVISLIDIATGAVDGYVGRGIPCWDILGMLPGLEQMGILTTIDWRTTGLAQKLDFVCGNADILSVAKRLD
ncbi:inositol monophosphatase [Ensifer sp. YR511]|uniref:inositol monophosphatase family protein n=1 Tax=Ensifer sp. YR511 TaxID=1855294 RepID=UPI00088A60CE|nr:inositol monophosphatase [Ensifer sp. YR511]SDN02179.1 myo-inositol-1(or 4)-monophosphatase [Ensifer sp. YR511]